MECQHIEEEGGNVQNDTRECVHILLNIFMKKSFAEWFRPFLPDVRLGHF